MGQEPKETDAGGARAQGYWRHDDAGPARYVSGPTDLGPGRPEMAETASDVALALAEYLGPAGRDVQVTALNPGLRLGGAAPLAVAGKAVSWAVRQGSDPVEDQINRTLTSPS